MKGDLMDSTEQRDVVQLLAQVHQGNTQDLGALLELYRDYLGVLARGKLTTALRAVVNPSDVVQQTFFEACRDFGQFAGTTEVQWRAWLRRILAHNLATLAEKHIAARKRDVRRQISLDQGAVTSRKATGCPGIAAVSPLSSPSAQTRRAEASAALANGLDQLPAAYREVLVLRNLEGLSFDEIARRMGRTLGAVRVLWVRALDRLRQLLKEEDLI
jgi:RNA polymerase sigma-70 factor (ECF subfamily)